METTTTKRPQRWDEPFGGPMADSQVNEILGRLPFSEMNPDAFPERLPLHEIIRNDMRIREYEEGDIVVREGDYGNSAFLVLEGSVDVCLKSLPDNLLGRASPKKRGWLGTIAQVWSGRQPVESRPSAGTAGKRAGARQNHSGTRIFLQDIQGVLDENNLATIRPGELFGEVAALSRSPRTATVIARGNAQLLEIRWQGLREVIKFDSMLRNYVDELYRENSLLVHLRATPFLEGLASEEIQEVADAAEFDAYGDFDWQQQFRKINQQDPSHRIEQEPPICLEGDYVNGLVLIRNGFARLSKQVGTGHQTLAYLGKGEVFGLKEIANSWKHQGPRKYEYSLRAVGYAEIIRVPIPVVENNILPHLDAKQLQSLLTGNWLANVNAGMLEEEDPDIETGLIEFLGEHRFINGTQTMLINLDRCTRCDDCVRACAATHDNNPRFNREGPKFGNQMVASACMHCVDPVCMIGCPTGAIGRDMTTGNILINDQTCIGCSTCANSCPYNNIKMVEIADQRGNPLIDEQNRLPILKATKCDLCSDQPGGPACVSACPHDALIRLQMNDAGTLNQWINR